MRVRGSPVMLIFLLLMASFSLPAAAQPLLGEPKGIELPMKLEVDDLINMTVRETGVVLVKEEVKATATGYLFLKQQYPMAFLFKRFIQIDKSRAELENLTVNFDDVNRRVTASYAAFGMTAKREGKWVLTLEGNAKLTARSGNTLIFTYMYPLPLGGKKTTVVTVHLPAGATDISVTKDEAGFTKIAYRLPSSSAGGGNLVIYAVLAVLVVLLILNVVLRDGLPGLFRRGGAGGGTPESQPQAQETSGPASSQ